MKTIPLKNFCDEFSQSKASEILGCTQGNVSQMIKAGREVFITIDPAGLFDWYEIRRPREKRKTKAAA